MLRVRIAAITFAAILPIGVSRADTVVARYPACADKSQAQQVYELLASQRHAEARKVFAAGVRARTCRILDLGEIVATLSKSELVRLASFTGRDKLWTSWQAIARCNTTPSWPGSPKRGAFPWQYSKRNAHGTMPQAAEEDSSRAKSLSSCPLGVQGIPDEFKPLVEDFQHETHNEPNLKDVGQMGARARDASSGAGGAQISAGSPSKDARNGNVGDALPTKPHRHSRSVKRGRSGLSTSGY